MTMAAGVRPVGQRFPLAWTISDTVTMTWRNLLNVVRQPQLMVFSTIQPVIFVLLFRYVFGGAIKPPGNVPYVDFLMPGIFIQTMAFGSINTGVGLAEDIRKGLIERFRSLPMARSSVLAGRAGADLIRNLWVIALMLAVGFAVGFRVHTNVFQFIGGLGVLLLFGFAMIWVFGLIGMFTQNGETAQAASFPIMAILVFASSAFVPTETMPHWLRLYTEHQPLSVTANAVRALTIGGPATTKVLTSVAWSTGIIAVFAPLAVRRYRKTG